MIVCSEIVFILADSGSMRDHRSLQVQRIHGTSSPGHFDMQMSGRCFRLDVLVMYVSYGQSCAVVRCPWGSDGHSCARPELCHDEMPRWAVMARVVPWCVPRWLR